MSATPGHRAAMLRSCVMPAQPPDSDAATRDSNLTRRKRVAFVALGAIVVLFVVQMVALALGFAEVSFLVLAAFVAGWFALRSFQKRNPV